MDLRDFDTKNFSNLRLVRTLGIGPVNFAKFLAKFKTSEIALENLEQFGKFSIPSCGEIEDEIALHQKIGAQLIFIQDPEYPEALKNIDSPPLFLSVLGKLNYKRSISIVGSRSASLLGKKFSGILAIDLGIRNFVIISGLAIGIDSAAHKASVENSFLTGAVLGSGINVIYPSKSLALEILDKGGFVISEFPINEQPRPQNFPRRNRIISGLSLGTVVVEANLKSGSIITAKCALEQGKQVFAVPGFPLDPRSSGTNQLIKDGAVLVTKVEDIFDALPFEFNSLTLEQSKVPNLNIYSDDISEQIMRALSSKTAVDINSIIDNFPQIPISKLLSIISELEINGRIHRPHEDQIELC